MSWSLFFLCWVKAMKCIFFLLIGTYFVGTASISFHQANIIVPNVPSHLLSCSLSLCNLVFFFSVFKKKKNKKRKKIFVLCIVFEGGERREEYYGGRGGVGVVVAVVSWFLAVIVVLSLQVVHFFFFGRSHLSHSQLLPRVSCRPNPKWYLKSPAFWNVKEMKNTNTPGNPYLHVAIRTLILGGWRSALWRHSAGHHLHQGWSTPCLFLNNWRLTGVFVWLAVFVFDSHFLPQLIELWVFFFLLLGGFVLTLDH